MHVCGKIRQRKSVKMWSTQNEIAVKFYAELERFPRDTPENLTVNSRKSMLRRISGISSEVAFACHRRRYRYTLCRFCLLLLFGGNVENEFYERKFPYDLRTRRKGRMAILNIQVDTDVTLWIVYSLTFRVSTVCLERKRVNILTNGLSGRFA